MTTSRQVIKALKISDIHINEIIVGTKKNNKKVPISLKDKPLVVQTPFLEVTGGSLRKTTYPNIYQLDILFKGDTKQKITQWFEFVENIETHISNQIINNGSKWFTQKNVVIKSLIRELESEKNTFFTKWAIDLKTNIFTDEHRKSFNPANLKDKDSIKLIIEISDLWIHENQCGLAVIVQKILVKPFVEKITSEYIFDESEDSETMYSDDENNIISLMATEQKTRPHKQDNLAKNNPSLLGLDTYEIELVENSKSSNQKHSKSLDQKSKIIDKNAANPFQSKQKSSLKTVFSDLSNDAFSSDEQNNVHGNNVMKQLVEEYSPSSDEMGEINEDDLEFDD